MDISAQIRAGLEGIRDQIRREAGLPVPGNFPSAFARLHAQDVALASAATLPPAEASPVPDLPPAPARPPSILDDRAFYDGKGLTAEQIDRILAEKKSPFAQQHFGDKTAGQLIFEMCQKAGTAPGGPHTLNPRLVLAVMGAETYFGTQGTWGKNNPFSIRLGGRFDKVKSFEESLRMAVNTLYNWAQARPQGDTTPLFDYAGNKYCEDYQETWRPNVIKLYEDFV